MYKMYSKSNCPFCIAAEDLFKIKNVQYQKFDLGIDYDREFLNAKLNYPEKLTVPQIWFNNEYIGGYDQLVKWFEKNGSQ